MLGQVELRTASVWAEIHPSVNGIGLRYWKEGTDKKSAKLVTWKGSVGNEFNPVVFRIGGLDPATNYTYELETLWKGKMTTKGGNFTTKDLWQWRKPAPDFSFITGSCNYVNEPVYDRPGKPYGGDSSIFKAMAAEKASFMLWLGDNWYTRDADYHSNWGLWYRASHDRSIPILQPLLKSMPQYAIWDDHDFGPNDMGKEYILKEDKSRGFYPILGQSFLRRIWERDLYQNIFLRCGYFHAR